MPQFALVQTTTPQGLIHQGIFAKPTQATKRGLLWIHGLTSTFYSNVTLINTLAEQAVAAGLAFASFNTRGHDFITGIKKVDATSTKGYSYVTAGSGYEVFEACADDIKGSLDFLVGEGVTEVILVGHSTGANKVSFFLASEAEERVGGCVLLGGLCDKLNSGKTPEELGNDIKLMHELVEQGRGESLMVGKTYFPLTPERFLSLYTPGPEDQFDYGENDPKLPYFSTITKPRLVIFGSADEYADRPVSEIVAVFDRLANKNKNGKYQSLIIEGATHSFTDKEQEVAEAIVHWTKNL